MNRDEFLKILPCYIGCELLGSQTRLRASMIQQYIDDERDNELVLRSLDQMVDDEQELAMNIAKSYWGSDDTLAGNSAERRIQVYARELNYLRSIGIDCDGLIEAGYAIKKEIE